MLTCWLWSITPLRSKNAVPLLCLLPGYPNWRLLLPPIVEILNKVDMTKSWEKLSIDGIQCSDKEDPKAVCVCVCWDALVRVAG